jgi:putative FmdB family regulatory protein
MPIYEYQCEECDQRTEAIQRLDEPPLEQCPHCGGKLRKLMSAPAFQFKGSGWYVTDYADKKKDVGKAGPSRDTSTSSTSSDTSSASKDVGNGDSSKAGDSA